MSGLEGLAAIASALGVWLTGRRTVWCWPVMLLASVLYGVVFAQDHLYADAALQGVFAALAALREENKAVVQQNLELK